ncbi:hypothetical protein L1049_011171 [Liquidambar formosana]|uniref:Transposase-associated domain-containing protein n=1 Tax=Liquidambar formosana TaxID=63359 RepID=A0AAP0RW93_LIQFO
MDKRWVKESRVSPEFEVGLERFLDFAFERAAYNGRILCPCDKCCNIGMLPRVIVRQHILLSGFDKGYMHCIWGLHGETTDIESSSNGEMSDEDDEDEPERGDDMHGMLEGVFGNPNMGVRDDVPAIPVNVLVNATMTLQQQISEAIGEDSDLDDGDDDIMSDDA